MRYDTLETTREKSLQFNLMDKGIDFGKNVWRKNGVLKVRPAIFSEVKNIIGKNISRSAEINDLKITDTSVFVDGKHHKIATVRVFDSNSACFVYVFLVDENQNVSDIGNMLFLRTNDDTFFIPENITFYVGESTDGGGIFALVTLVNMMDFSSREYHIYEINKDFTAWSKNYNYYVPTVYINGRGNYYELAKQLDIASEAVPKELETLNMLDGRFYAYYSSDSYSTSFKLPFSQLSDEPVMCRIYINSQSYKEWCIMPTTNSESLDFFGTSVVLKLDRENGVITFYSENSEYAVPQMSGYRENNIRIFAKKEITSAFNRVVSCKHSAVLNSNIVFSGGIKGSEIYYTKYENPLYFPLVLDNQVGSPTSSITALTTLGNSVIAFKDSEMYLLEPPDTKPVNTTNLLTDNPAIFYTDKAFKIKNISDTVGCANKYSIAKLGGRLIWQTSGGNICAFSGNSVYCICDEVKSYIESQNFSDVCATAFEKYYIMCNDSKAVVLDLTDEKKVLWYAWEFPEICNIGGVFSYNNKPVFLCADREKAVCYIAGFAGERDLVLKYEKGEIKEKNFEIETEIKSSEYKICELGKAVKINKIFLDMLMKSDAEIKVTSRENFCDFKLSKTDFSTKNSKIAKIEPNLKSDGSVWFTVKSEKPIELCEVAIYFTNINSD